MTVEEELAKFTAEDSVLTIGVFDGVHLGHRHLISELLNQAKQKKVLSGVVTFLQHPEDLLTSGKKLPFLTDITTRINLLKEAGVDFVVTLTFTSQMARLDARVFVELLQKYLKMRGMVIGPDFALGKERQGDIDTLQRLGQEMNFSVTVVPPLKINGEVVSSTAIRQALADGDMEKYARLTGHSFSLHGRVVTGAGRGEGLGFPTANLDVSSGQAVPPDGVYAGLAHINGRVYQTMTNIGRNPTFGKNERTVESFLLEYHGDLYGHELSVDFISRLRDEKKFINIEELKKQVAEDVRRGKILLDSTGVNKQ
ncbi:MAG: riboflavin biosynthesis protein RibF [Chloroflexi bacterium RBG_13_52_12]|nr:MAG: riboflavin biosynthesis protein RibF [Chloroflexi bacterium RBG_13_52_12]